jgi:hypothetical protein
VYKKLVILSQSEGKFVADTYPSYITSVTSQEVCACVCMCVCVCVCVYVRGARVCHSFKSRAKVMVNFRHRTKGKGKRWKKGHSSSSNPEIKRYRNVAKSRFFQEHSGKRTIQFMLQTMRVAKNCAHKLYFYYVFVILTQILQSCTLNRCNSE